MSNLSSYSRLMGQLSAGGTGGSKVEITPALEDGVKIADYEIDGESGALYAPVPINNIVQTYRLHVIGLGGYNLYLNKDNALLEAIPVSTNDEVITIPLYESGTYTITNSFNDYALTHNVNVVESDMIITRITKPLTVVSGQSNFNFSRDLVEGMYYLFLMSSTGNASEVNYNPCNYVFNDCEIIYNERAFDSSDPTNNNYCSEMRAIIVKANAGASVTLSNGGFDRARLLVLSTDEILTSADMITISTAKDRLNTTTFNIALNESISIFCLGNETTRKDITGPITTESIYNNDNMYYDYVTGISAGTVTINFTGGTSYGMSGVVVLK